METPAIKSAISIPADAQAPKQPDTTPMQPMPEGDAGPHVRSSQGSTGTSSRASQKRTSVKDVHFTELRRTSRASATQRHTLISQKEVAQLEQYVDEFLDAPDAPESPGMEPKEICSFIAFAILLCIFVYLAYMGYVQKAAVAAADLGPGGHLIFIALYIFVAMPFGWGYSVVIIAGGFSFGWTAIITAEVGTLVGSFIAYLLSMKAMANWVKAKLKTMKPKTQKTLLAIELAIRQGKGGLGMQTGLRVNPVLPYGWTNAVLGIWEVAPLSFVFSTMIGCQIDIILKTNLGVILATAGDLNKQTPETQKMMQTQLMIQCAVFAVVLIAGCTYSRWIMKNIMPQEVETRKSTKVGDVKMWEIEECGGEDQMKSLAQQLHGGEKSAQNGAGWYAFVKEIFRIKGCVMIKAIPVSLFGGFLSFALVYVRIQNPDLLLLPELRHPFVVQIWSFILAFVIVARTNIAIKRYFDGMKFVHTMSSRWVDGFTSLLGFLRSSYDMHPDDSEKKVACEALGLACLHWTTLAHACALNSLQATQMGLDESIWEYRVAVLQPPDNASLSAPPMELVTDEEGVVHRSRGKIVKDAMSGEGAAAVESKEVTQSGTGSHGGRELMKLGIFGPLQPAEIQSLHGSTDKTSIVLMWIEEAISRCQVQGILLTAPPILARVYSELGSGLEAFNNAYRLALVPFPFCFAQMIAWCLVIFTFLCPAVAYVFTGGEMLTAVLTFICLMGFFGLNRIAMELENPYGTSVNHIPLAELHHAYVEAIAEMHQHPMPEYEYIPEGQTGEEKVVWACRRNMLE